MGQTVQFLITMGPGRYIRVQEIDARVPSGMGVILTEFRSDRVLPTKVELIDKYEGSDMAEIVKALEAGLEDTKISTPDRKPWRMDE